MILVDVAIKATYSEFRAPGISAEDAIEFKVKVAELVQKADAKLQKDIAKLGLVKSKPIAMIEGHIYTEVFT